MTAVRPGTPVPVGELHTTPQLPFVALRSAASGYLAGFGRTVDFEQLRAESLFDFAREVLEKAVP